MSTVFKTIKTNKMNIQLKKVKINRTFSRETIQFFAELHINGKHIGFAENDGQGGSTNYYRDFGVSNDSLVSMQMQTIKDAENSIRAALGDEDARQYLRAAADTTDNAGLVPTRQLSEIINPLGTTIRPSIDAISRGVLPDAGMTFEIPKITQVPTVGEVAEDAAFTQWISATISLRHLMPCVIIATLLTAWCALHLSLMYGTTYSLAYVWHTIYLLISPIALDR